MSHPLNSSNPLTHKEWRSQMRKLYRRRGLTTEKDKLPITREIIALKKLNPNTNP